MSAPGPEDADTLASRFFQTLGLENWGSHESWSSRPQVNADLGGLLMSIVGGTVVAWFTGVIGLIQGIGGGLTSLLGFVTDTQAALYNAIFGIEDVITVAAVGTQVQVSTTGPAAFLFAIASVAVAAIILNWGVSQLE